MTELAEVFADPSSTERVAPELDRSGGASRHGMLALFQAYRKVRDELEMTSGDGRDVGGFNSPVEQVRGVLQDANNYFPELEAAAEESRAAILGGREGGSALLEGLGAYMAERLGLRVRVIPASVMGTQLRRHDHHRREILLSESLRRPQRLFHLLVQAALIERSELMAELTERYGVSDDSARSLLRSTLAGYFAAAVMMPYDSFLESARELRHDLDLLGRRFGASFEQVCHRLTSLNAPQSRGIPFFFIRIDDAGNISKRLAAGGMQFAKNGGTCPRWDIHKAFRTPDRMLFQAAELPNGQKFFTIARTVPRPWAPAGESPPEFAVALGCEMHHARDLVYADDPDGGRRRTLDPIGIGYKCEHGLRASASSGHEVSSTAMRAGSACMILRARRPGPAA